MTNKNHDYQILWNMPYKHLIQYWSENKNDLRNEEMYHWKPELETITWKSHGLKPNHPVHKMIEEMFVPLGLTLGSTRYMITVANHGMVESLHLDPPAREVAINIPIEIEEYMQFFVIGNDKDLKEVPRTGRNKTVRYYLEPEKCSFYNSRKPWIFNTQKPHGFSNYASTDRVVMSISILEDYNTVLNALPKEWF